MNLFHLQTFYCFNLLNCSTKDHSSLSGDYSDPKFTFEAADKKSKFL